MRKSRHWPLLASLCIAASLLLPTSPASASESIPELQYPAIPVGRYESMVSGPDGSVTLPCNNLDSGIDLVTYDNTGAVVRKIDRTQTIDGVKNCITKPVVDKNGTLYGIPYDSSWGPNLLAYSGNNLKWKYPARCGSSSTPVTVGANGNIYTTQYQSDGVHLIGLTPDVATGQTQPTKILDVKIADDCSVQFFPYRDGLLLRGQNSGFKYYSYSGKLLAQPQVNRFWDARVGASGELFDTTTGSFNSVNVTMYSPRTSQTAWTTVASTPGAATQSTSLYPIPDGGVAALIKEQKMVSDGVPATPTTYIFTLAILNAAGQRVGAVEVPSKDPAGNMFTNHRIVPSDNGKLAIVSDVQLVPSYTSAISIRVFDIATASWTFQQIMSGDASKPGGPSGFYPDQGPAISDNTIFLIGQCSGNCTVYQEKKLYALKAPVGLGLNYPRATLLFPRPASPYVALGDSFSAGEGVEPFEANTDFFRANECHRSAKAYPRLIAGTSAKIPEFGIQGFRACSGARSTNITDAGQWNENFQLDWTTSPDIRLITATIGGNDIGFGDFGVACGWGTCEKGSDAYNKALGEINHRLPGRLEETLKKILWYAPNAHVYIVGYPQIVSDKAPTDPWDLRCFYLYEGTEPWGDARAAREIVTLLNSTIYNVVDKVRKSDPLNHRLRYISTDGPNSPFHGHEVCGPNGSWFYNVDQVVNNKSYVFHPNELGQAGLAMIVANEINAN